MATFSIVQNDTAPPIQSRLADSGDVIDLRGASNVFFHMENEYSQSVISDDLTGRVNIVNAPSGDVEYAWKDGDTDDIGTYRAEWQVLYDDGKIETFPTGSQLEVEIIEEIQ